MKTWIKRTLFGLFGVTALAGGLSACGHHHEGHGWQLSAQEQAQRREKMVERVSSKLDLSAEQKQRLNTLADRLQEQRTALVGKTTDPRAEARALVAGEKFDRARAQALLNEKTAALTSRSPEVLAALADFYDSLKPEQQARVREFLQGRPGFWRRG